MPKTYSEEMVASAKQQILAMQRQMQQGIELDAFEQRLFVAQAVYLVKAGHFVEVAAVLHDCLDVEAACGMVLLHDSVAALKTHGVIDAHDCNDSSLALYAAGRGYLELVMFLIDAGADAEQCNAEGDNALDLLIVRREISDRRLMPLLSSMAGVDRVDRSGQTVLMRSILHGRVELTRALLAKEPDLDVFDKRGHDVLHHLFHSVDLSEQMKRVVLHDLLKHGLSWTDARVDALPLRRSDYRDEGNRFHIIHSLLHHMRNNGFGLEAYRCFSRLLAEDDTAEALFDYVVLPFDVNELPAGGRPPCWQAAIDARNVGGLCLLERMGMDWTSAVNHLGQTPGQYAIAQGIRDVDFLALCHVSAADIAKLDAQQCLSDECLPVAKSVAGVLSEAEQADLATWISGVKLWLDESEKAAAADAVAVADVGLFGQSSASLAKRTLIEALAAGDVDRVRRICTDELSMLAITDANELPISYAIRIGINNPKLLLCLLPSVGATVCLSMPDAYGRTALAKAITNGDMAQIDFLYQQGAELAVDDVAGVDAVQAIAAVCIFYPSGIGGAGGGLGMPDGLCDLGDEFEAYMALHQELKDLQATIAVEPAGLGCLSDLAQRFRDLIPGHGALSNLADTLDTIARPAKTLMAAP